LLFEQAIALLFRLQQRQVGTNEGRPCGRALALRCRRQTVALQDIADGLIGSFLTIRAICAEVLNSQVGDLQPKDRIVLTSLV
jgi:hypothetical protein